RTRAKRHFVECDWRYRTLSFEQLLWGVPLCMSAHNAEEALGIRELLTLVERLPPRVGTPLRRFAFAGSPRRFLALAAPLTLATWLLAALAVREEPPGLLGAALVCVQVGLFLNALVPHLLLSLWSRRYTPGVATALLLNVPFTPYLLYRAHRTDLF
ncbi:MAG: HXXEE domain-containing protein, partial [Chloroflexota bacterium]|nr:HXXEE domain-containing protein [Chloroflexota bacterium]